MKQLIGCVIVLTLLMACSEGGRKKTARFYKANEKALSATQEINNFSLQLAYMPATIMPGAKDTGYYHFRLQVQCPASSTTGSGSKTALLYGLDSLFTAGGSDDGILPVSVEPVIAGSNTHFEYLLVFAKKDLKAGNRLEIIFHDKLFTNTRMNFVFDRTKIDEIEQLHS